MQEHYLVSGQKTMTSVEIAELTGKRHDHVVRDLQELEKQGIIDLPKFGEREKYGNNNERTVYRLPKREVLILTSGYSAKQRAAIIDRWLELEEQAQKSLSPAEAFMQQAQIMLKVERELNAVKAEQVDMRDKQAEVEKKVDVINAKQDAILQNTGTWTALAYMKHVGIKGIDNKEASRLGRIASRLSREQGYRIGKMVDPRFETVNLYDEEILDQAIVIYRQTTS